MNRNWMYGDRREMAFQKGVTEFCNAALEHQRVRKEPTIFCPCRDCCNVKRWTDISKIEYHLYRRGFRSDYETWYWHGEKLVFGDEKNEVEIGANPCEGNANTDKKPRESYEGKKRLPPPSESSTAESSVLSSKVQNRALEWCLARQSRTRDGKWKVDPNKVETARVVNQVMKNLENEAKEKEDGASISEVGNDALSKALGKRDYYGYVKGIGRSGVGVGHRKAFGKVSGKGSDSRDVEIEALKATVAQLKSELEAQFSELEAQKSKFEAYIASLSEREKGSKLKTT